MNNRWHYILLTTLLATAASARANANMDAALAADAMTAADAALAADTATTDTVAKTRVNRAQGFNALKYIMERRFRNHDDTFTKKWHDHLFLELGMGMAQDVGEVDGRGLTPLVGVHFAVGKQFSKTQTFRLTVGTEFGSREVRATNFTRLGFKLDWMYSLSNYLDGYNPARTLDLNTIVGVGYRTLLSDSPEMTKGRSGAEAHIGLQFKFFTGPQGYLVAEPYIGAGSTNIARKFDMFYGVNLGFMYFIHNNLSPEQRVQYMKERPAGLEDYKACTWQTPWFFEAAYGLALPTEKPEALESGQAMGNTAHFAVGRWLSPALGLRLGLDNTTKAWAKGRTNTFVGGGQNAAQSFENLLYGNNLDLRLEALINPLGFGKNYNWHRSWGVNLIVGGGVGWLTKNQDPVRLHVNSTFYGGGLQAWVKLCDGVRFFVEPRYTSYNYRIPYNNVYWAKRFNDNLFNVNVGLQAMIIEKMFRKTEPAVEDEVRSSLLKGFTFGAGAGTSLMHKAVANVTDGMRYNFNGFVEYRFRNSVHGARLQFEYASLNSMSLGQMDVIDKFGEKMEVYDQNGNLLTHSPAMYKNQYSIGLASVSYLLDLSAAFAGRSAAATQRIHVDAFAGPMMMIPVTNKSSLASTCTLYGGQTSERVGEPTKPKSTFGINAGVKIAVGVTKHIAVTVTPQLYWFSSDPTFEGITLRDFNDRFFETISLGVQYKM